MRTTLKIAATFVLALALAGCGALRFGGDGSKLGDGQIDLLRLLAITSGIQSGDAGPLCQTILAGQAGADEAMTGLLLAACRGLLSQTLGAQASPLVPPPVVAGSAVPSGDACAELKIAYELTASACKW